MDTVVPPRDDTDLDLLTHWGTTFIDPSRGRRAAVFSLLAHGVVILLLFMVPAGIEEPPREVAEVQRVTPLIEPPAELTQRVPNIRKPAKEFNANQVQPRPNVQAPRDSPSTSRPRAPRLTDLPQAPVTPAPTPLPEPPKVEEAPPRSDLPQITQLEPQIQPVEKPKIALQNVTPAAPPPTGQGRVPIPNPSVSEAIRQSLRGGMAGGQVVGDLDLGGAGSVGEGMNLPPTPGVQASQLELLSDPKGVDFRPYLTQVLAAVRRNWLAVVPESAKMGRQGRVGIQFSISREGSVPKLVIVLHSGTDALDRAAVAGVSASNPFPPLPPEFRGDRIVLQFNFAYNVPRRR